MEECRCNTSDHNRASVAAKRILGAIRRWRDKWRERRNKKERKDAVTDRWTEIETQRKIVITVEIDIKCGISKV